MVFFPYVYYRLVKFYKKAFGIEKPIGFLIQDCYSWGLFILLNTICFYFLSIETVFLCSLGVKMKTLFVLITFLPFLLLHVFSEEIFGNLESNFKELCHRYKNDSYKWLKGLCVLLFVSLAIPCYIIIIFLFK